MSIARTRWHAGLNFAGSVANVPRRRGALQSAVEDVDGKLRVPVDQARCDYRS